PPWRIAGWLGGLAVVLALAAVIGVLVTTGDLTRREGGTRAKFVTPKRPPGRLQEPAPPRTAPPVQKDNKPPKDGPEEGPEEKKLPLHKEKDEEKAPIKPAAPSLDAAVLQRVKRGVAFIEGKASRGAAFVVRPGVLATNNHVLQDEYIDQLRVRFITRDN